MTDKVHKPRTTGSAEFQNINVRVTSTGLYCYATSLSNNTNANLSQRFMKLKHKKIKPCQEHEFSRQLLFSYKFPYTRDNAKLLFVFTRTDSSNDQP